MNSIIDHQQQVSHNQLELLIIDSEKRLRETSLNNTELNDVFERWCIFTRLKKAYSSGLVTHDEVNQAIQSDDSLKEWDDIIDSRLWDKAFD